MLAEAEKYAAEDEKQKLRIASRNQLEGYIFSAKQVRIWLIFESHHLTFILFQAVENAPADKLTEDDKKQVQDKCSAALQWLDSNQLAEKEEFEDKLKDLQKECQPVMMKLHQGGGAQAQGGQGGPKVEEVD